MRYWRQDVRIPFELVRPKTPKLVAINELATFHRAGDFQLAVLGQFFGLYAEAVAMNGD